MNSFKKLLLSLACSCSAFVSSAFAAVNSEMDGLESITRADGTFLVGSPTFIYDRILGAGGIHSESDVWSPHKLHRRLLVNRLSSYPSWKPIETPSVWMKTGNELGDLIYQEFITEYNDRPQNRTPIMGGGLRTPSYKGFWATVRYFQDDFYAARSYPHRKNFVDDDFTYFGGNWPYQSSMYGGLGYTSDFVDASILAGAEYLWIAGESMRWIPVHYAPRVEANASFENLFLNLNFEKAEYQEKRKSEKGNRIELSGSAVYKCGSLCNSFFDVSLGLSFRALDDSGTVYTELEDDKLVWPFVELHVQPLKNLTLDATFGINNRDWLVEDSLEFHFPVPKQMGLIAGVKNISGTRLNPIADTKEFFDGDTISLTADGQMNLVQGYVRFADTLGIWDVRARASFWAEHGAETFDVDEFVKDSSFFVYRHGDVSRINSWIKGISAELWLTLHYQEWLSFSAMGGFEKIDGPERRFEVNPAEYFVAFSGDWLLRKSFRISHSIHYRSDAKWNLRSKNPLVVKGDWFWDATFEQLFPKWGLSLSGTLIHVLADENIEVPNGGYSRVRFFCEVRKTF